MRLHSLSTMLDPAAALSPPYPCAQILNVGTISPIRTVPLKSSPIRIGLCLLEYRELTLHSTHK